MLLLCPYFHPQKVLQINNINYINIDLNKLNIYVIGLALNSEPLVMPYLNSTEWMNQEEQEISVDSCLVAKLREHQRHGILFLYECLKWD